MTKNGTRKGLTEMADSQRKKDWDRRYMLMVTFKLFREYNGDRNDQDIIDYISRGNRSEIIKQALREYMNNHN